MTIYKCDRCGEECKPHKTAGYEFCDECYERFIDFVNMRDCSPEGVQNVLVEYGQNDIRFHVGDTIKYSPLEVGRILRENRHG